MLDFFEVIWVFDRTTRPQKRKMYVCLSFEDGWFLRVNTSDRYRPCVAIQTFNNDWLDHDSYVECALLEVDEFEIEDALRREPPLGFLHKNYLLEVRDKMLSASFHRPSDISRLEILFADQI